jgi:hypothetical protein
MKQDATCFVCPCSYHPCRHPVHKPRSFAFAKKVGPTQKFAIHAKCLLEMCDRVFGNILVSNNFIALCFKSRQNLRLGLRSSRVRRNIMRTELELEMSLRNTSLSLHTSNSQSQIPQLLAYQLPSSNKKKHICRFPYYVNPDLH